MAESYKKYFSMQAKGKETAEIMIYEQIGKNYWDDSGVGAKEFAKELKAFGDISKIILRINSPGGSVFEGLAIYNTLVSHVAEKEIHIDGLAASIASVIAMSGKVIMPENAMMMIHDPFGLVMGDSEDMRKMAETLDKIKDSIIMAYQTKSTLEQKDIAELMTDETWMNGKDAKDWGFADEVIEPVKISASFDLSKFKHAPKIVNEVTEPAAIIEPVIPVITPKEVKNMVLCKICTEALDDNGECPRCKKEVEVKNATKVARESEIQRAKDLRAIAKDYSKHPSFNAQALAEIAIDKDWTADQFRLEILSRIKNASPQSSPHITVESMRGARPFNSLGEQLLAVANAARGRMDNRLIEIQNAATGASESVPSDGGFLVQSDFTTALLDKANEVEILAPKCYHIPVTGNGIEAPVIDETDRATGSRWGGVQIYRVSEAGTATKKKPKFGKLEMKLEKLMGLFYATDELLMDATALESIVTRAFTEEFAFKIDDEIVNGTGAGQMLGILNSGALVTVTKETGQLAATIMAENIMKMYSRMPARLVPGAEWYINQEIWPQLFGLQLTIGTGGVPLFMPPGGLSVAPFGTLMGRPIQPIEQAAALGTAGDIIFANLKQYAIIEKGGLNAAQSIHLMFLTDENTYRWTFRNNGQPIWKSPLTPYKGSATTSPFIVLGARA